MKNNAFLKAGRRWFFRIVVAAGCATLFALSVTPVQAQQRTVLPGHVPAPVNQLRLRPLRQLAATNRLHLAIGLQLRNREALTNLLHQLYDSASPQYHHFLTPEQFNTQFGPTEQDYQAAAAFAQANGLTLNSRQTGRMLLDASGTAGEIEKAFHVTLNVYQRPGKNSTFFAPAAEPSVPPGLRILDVSGLSDYSRPYPKFVMRPPGLSTNASPREGSGPGGTYMGYDFRKAYVPGIALTGAGQTVALVQFDGYTASDITTYANLAGLPGVPTLQNVLLNGFNGIPTGTGGEVEVSLDIEMVMCMAPGINRIILYEGNPFNFSPNDVLNRIVADNSAKQISCSWGWTGGPSATTDQIFQQMAAQGQSFYVASGDSDAYVPGQLDDPAYTGAPASSPYVTTVGGTTLTTTGPGGSYSSETVWNWGGGVGSSGGISSYYGIPSWQQGVDMSANGGSTTHRNIPDVALTADNVLVVANGQQMSVGGTSAASPLWAGFTALANQQALTVGKPAVGFVNPEIYDLGKGSDYTSTFHDITTGDNTSPDSPNAFYATNGYDLCTGWGTPTANLIPVLAGTPPRNGFLVISVDPPTDSAILSGSSQPISVTVGDVFGITNATVTATIPGITNLTFVNSSNSLSTYTATFQVPNISTPVTMTVTANAPDEIGVTNTVDYFIAYPPSNDDFANATKVPVNGATYLSNNRFATIETNEPLAFSDPAAAGSLWWNWTPANNTNVLINTIGSKVDNILAVYTGAALATNMPIIAQTNSDLTQYRPAQVSFSASAGVTYHIVLASQSTNQLGTVGLVVAPGGQPDSTKPLVSIVSPLNGLTVVSNFMTVTGTATDPQPNATGIHQVSINVNGSVYGVSGTTNWNALAALLPGVNTIQVTAVDKSGNYSLPTSVEVIYVLLGPGNDFFAQSTNLPYQLVGASGTVSNSTTEATKEVGEPNHAGNSGGKSIWWSFQPPANGLLTLNTTNSTFDTLLGLYTGTSVSNLTTIASDDDAYEGAPGGFSFFSQAVQSNQVYYIAVDGYNGASGEAELAYTFTPEATYRLTATSATGGTVIVTSSNVLGGIATMHGSSGDFAAGTAVELTAVPNEFYQFENWNGDSALTANPLSVTVNSDTNLTANFTGVAVTDGFESGNLQHLTWKTSGDAPWLVQSSVVESGQYAARSGAIGNNQISSLSLTTNFVAGLASFDYRVSTETNFDYLKFYVNGILQRQWSGDTGWANYTFPVNAGTNTLEWTYVKDPSLTNGLDAAFLDNVILPLAAQITSLASPKVQLRRESDGSFVMQISGQPNQQYILQASTNLIDWQNISTNVAVGGSIGLTNPVSADYPARFYRAVVAH